MGKKLSYFERAARAEKKAQQRERNARAAAARRSAQRKNTAIRKEKERIHKAKIVAQRRKKEAYLKEQEIKSKKERAERFVLSYNKSIESLQKLHIYSMHPYVLWQKDIFSQMENYDTSSEPELHSLDEFETFLENPSKRHKKELKDIEKQNENDKQKLKKKSMEEIHILEKDYKLSIKEFIRKNNYSGFFLSVLLNKTKEKYEKFVHEQFNKYNERLSHLEKDLQDMDRLYEDKISQLEKKHKDEIKKFKNDNKNELEKFEKKQSSIKRKNEEILKKHQEIWKKKCKDANDFLKRLSEKNPKDRINLLHHEYMLLFYFIFPLDFIKVQGPKIPKNSSQIILDEFTDEDYTALDLAINSSSKLLYINIELNFLNPEKMEKSQYFLSEYGLKLKPSGNDMSEFKHSKKLQEDIADQTIASMVLAYCNVIFNATDLEIIKIRMSTDGIDLSTGNVKENVILAASIDKSNFEKINLAKVNPLQSLDNFNIVKKSIKSDKDLKIPDEIFNMGDFNDLFTLRIDESNAGDIEIFAETIINSKNNNSLKDLEKELKMSEGTLTEIQTRFEMALEHEVQ